MAKASAKGRIAAAEPRVRRGYFECRYGQLHVHNAIPPGGGFDEATPLLCLHPSPASGHAFHRLSRALAQDRSVYAPDLPGFGDSDAPPDKPSIDDYAAAIGDFCDTMRLRQIDVLGCLGGSFVAAELAIVRATQVRRVALMGLPIASDAEREAFRHAPWPLPPAADGSHLLIEWQRTIQSRTGLPLDAAARAFADKLLAGANAGWGTEAALEYPARTRLGRVTQPTLLVRPRDEASDPTLRARELMPRARFLELSASSNEMLELAPEALLAALREFLRG
ncbi:MAG TPA: alpha/beta fold hydrolase [Steroidobacteraceae bacterium]|nr:alpha/beta fold hydrolase [Steroidobacteraceae bacterium]